MFYGNIWLTGKVGFLGNNIDREKVGDFGDILGDTSVYTRFGHQSDSLMGSMTKALTDSLRRQVVDNAHDT